jgi:hypothetical protein
VAILAIQIEPHWRDFKTYLNLGVVTVAIIVGLQAWGTDQGARKNERGTSCEGSGGDGKS